MKMFCLKICTNFKCIFQTPKKAQFLLQLYLLYAVKINIKKRKTKNLYNLGHVTFNTCRYKIQTNTIKYIHTLVYDNKTKEKSKIHIYIHTKLKLNAIRQVCHIAKCCMLSMMLFWEQNERVFKKNMYFKLELNLK